MDAGRAFVRLFLLAVLPSGLAVETNLCIAQAIDPAAIVSLRRCRKLMLIRVSADFGPDAATGD